MCWIGTLFGILPLPHESAVEGMPDLCHLARSWTGSHSYWLQCYGSVPLTNGSGSGSCYFRFWPSKRQVFLRITFWRYIYSRNQGFPDYFCLMIEESGSRSVPLTNESRSGSGSSTLIGFLSVKAHSSNAAVVVHAWFKNWQEYTGTQIPKVPAVKKHRIIFISVWTVLGVRPQIKYHNLNSRRFFKMGITYSSFSVHIISLRRIRYLQWLPYLVQTTL